jgi:hypothetical protein
MTNNTVSEVDEPTPHFITLTPIDETGSKLSATRI